MTFINDLSPVLIHIGPVTIRWYGVLLSSGIISYYFISKWIFRKEGYPLSDLDGIIIYLFWGLIIGARLGEVIFYEPSFYFSNPVEILKIWNGGLSSHGASLGLFTSYIIWTRTHRASFTKYVDALVIGMPVTAAFVRTGNFFNSEIVGKPVGDNYYDSWGVVFRRLGEDFPRHPAQLYEAVLSIAVFFVLFLTYRRYYRKTPRMFFFFLFMGLYFSGRFIIEFWKDLHGLPGWFPLSTGQVLSIVPVMISAGYFLIASGLSRRN